MKAAHTMTGIAALLFSAYACADCPSNLSAEKLIDCIQQEAAEQYEQPVFVYEPELPVAETAYEGRYDEQPVRSNEGRSTVGFKTAE